MRRGLVRFGFVAVLENLVQMNFQITLLALCRRTRKSTMFEKRAFASIILCLICSVIRVFHLIDLLLFSREVRAAVTEFEERKRSVRQVDAEQTSVNRQVDAGEAGAVWTSESSVIRTEKEGWTVS